MKRRTMILVVLAVAGVAAWAADVPKVVADAWKFKWAGATEAEKNKLNGPADCTELEYRCAKASRYFRATKLTEAFDIQGVAIEPTVNGLRAVVLLHPLDKFRMAPGEAVAGACQALRAQISASVCPVDEKFSELSIEVYLDTSMKRIAVRDVKGIRFD
ncbi:MAG: hypothetical protein IMZ50_06090 [Candidatus Atribacteria bacterium]|nr:hypothetical protein [Candidatus Atribacteria bacterium]